MHVIQARRFDTCEPIEIEIADGIVVNISPLDSSSIDEEALPFVSPGLFDIQINGYAGIWFCNPSLRVEDVVAVTEALVRKGIARYFPTLITASHEALKHGFETLKAACDQNELVRSSVAGYHLEGPFISAEDGPRGAHPLQHVRPADFEEFSQLQEASGNRIRLVTLAAETGNAVEFIQKCRAAGVVVAIGHTGASPDQIRAAVDAGAQLSTHFGNGAHGMLPRHPNYLWEQLADDRLSASVIADGWHVPPSVLKCVCKCKPAGKVILTCDVSGFAGCRPGTYQEGDVAVEVLDDGRIVVAGQRQFLAGSGATTGECIAGMINAVNVSLEEAVTMATTNPGTLFDEPIPTIENGQTASLSVFHINRTGGNGPAEFIPICTFVQGNRHDAV